MTARPFAAYRAILRRRDVGTLLGYSFLARIPIAAAPLVLTLHVVETMNRGFASSGLLAAVFATGAAIGAPLQGRTIDRMGLRPVLVVSTAVDSLFWLSASRLGYHALIAGAFVGGLLAIPVFSVIRQSLAAMLPEAERQAGFSLDSISVELAFAVGPAAGIALLTQAGTRTTLWVLGVLIAVSGISLIVLNPPIRSADEDAAAAAAPEPVRLRDWLRRDAAALLLITGAAAFILAGTDTAIVAVLRSFGDIGLVGLVISVWCLASIVGGLVYGAGRRVEPLLLLALLGAMCVPAAAATTWWLLALLVVPTGLFCAPVISATAQELVRLTPATARGHAMGIHGSALTVGAAAGAPSIGVVVDQVDPRWAFVAVGLVGVAMAAAIALLSRVGPGPASPVADRTGGAGPSTGVCLPASK